VLSADGTKIAYTRSGQPYVAFGTGLPLTFSGTTGVVYDLSGDGTKVLWRGTGASAPGSTDHSKVSGLYLSDMSTGTTRQIDVASGGVESAFGMAGPPTRLADLSGDGRLVVFDSAGRSFANETDDDIDVFVRDVDAGTTVPLGSAASQFSLSDDGNLLVSLRSQILWTSALPVNRAPSAPTITLFGPQGTGLATVWQPASEQPSKAPTEVLFRRFENGNATPVEDLVLPYSASVGIHLTPSVPPGSSQRVEVRLRNATGTSAPAVTPTLATSDNVVVDVQLDGPSGPVPYAAVIAYDTTGRAVTFGATSVEGTTQLYVQPGTYRFRSYANDDTPFLDAWYGGGPLSPTGTLSVAAGDHPSITIAVGKPGTVTPVSYSQWSGLLDVGNTTSADLGTDGRYVGMVTAVSLTRNGHLAAVRDLQTGKLEVPCGAPGGGTGGGQIAVADGGDYVARVSADRLTVSRCSRATKTWTTLNVNPTNTNGDGILAGTLKISADGKVVVFAATTVAQVSGDTAKPDVFAWRPDTNDLRRLTLDTAGSSTSAPMATSLTADGSTVAVLTPQVLDPADTFGDTTLYLVDTVTGAASIASPHPAGGSAHATGGVVSADGSSVAFVSSLATLPGSKNGASRAYRFRPSTGAVVAASGDGAGKGHTGDVGAVSISGDGNRVAFTVTQPSLLDVVGDDAALSGAYVYDVRTAMVDQIDVAANQPRVSATGTSTIELDATGDAAMFVSADRLIPAKFDATREDTFYWTRAQRPAYVAQAGDGDAPVLKMPTMVVAVAAPGATGADVTWGPWTALDAVDGTLPVTCVQGPGWYPVGGITSVPCYAVDAAGNMREYPLSIRVVSQGATRIGSDGATCSILQDTTVTCSGSNANGWLGRGTATSTTQPREVPGITGATAITVSTGHTCVVASGDVKCWGAGTAGQLGNGTTASSNVPVTAAGIAGHATGVSSYSATTCAVLDDGTVRCWGANTYGQVGDGTTVIRSTPQPVTGLTGVTQVASGDGHSCARRSDGTVWCWGLNSNGQLGLGNQTSSSVPVAVPGLTGVVDVSAGQTSTCATLTDGTVRCWGAGSLGQLGTGTTTRYLQPTAVAGLTGAVETQVFDSTACSRRSDGSVWCWGVNNAGQLGGGASGTTSLSAVAVPTITDAVAFGSGRRPCFVLSGGTVRCTYSSTLVADGLAAYPSWYASVW